MIYACRYYLYSIYFYRVTVSDSHFALVVTVEKIYFVDLSVPPGSESSVPLPLPVVNPTAAVYNPGDDRVYWAEDDIGAESLGQIRRASLDGTNVETLISFPC